ncbi:MAG TPA: hypothetical protein VFN80_05005 [Acidothermaceae bacterium]|jgi:hypothetical protein|nr:hypothetical protein [Acidothermaceae bacterium]
MRQTSYRVTSTRDAFDAELPGRAADRKATRTDMPREFDGIPGLRNSQALRDWARATADLDRAKQWQSPPDTIAELSRDVARAYARLQALSARHR